MNKKTFISILLLLSLGVVLIVFFNNKSNDNTTIKETINHNSDKQASTKNIEQNSKLSPKVLPIESVTDEIQNFNEQIAKDLSIDSYDNSARINAIKQLQIKPRNDYVDVLEEIDNYLENIEENQIEINKLILSCIGMDKNLTELEKKLTQPNSNINERSFSFYYFYQGLRESKLCDKLGSKSDPFFVFLKSARKGDLLSRLLLVDHLVFAMQRKLINPWKHPLEYMNLRDEAISYLKILAAKGVTRSSVKLAQIYSNGIIAPPNRILEYYYTFLAKKQEGVEEVYLREPSDIYYHLTEKQKTIADRMTENL